MPGLVWRSSDPSVVVTVASFILVLCVMFWYNASLTSQKRSYADPGRVVWFDIGVGDGKTYLLPEIDDKSASPFGILNVSATCLPCSSDVMTATSDPCEKARWALKYSSIAFSASNTRFCLPLNDHPMLDRSMMPTTRLILPMFDVTALLTVGRKRNLQAK